MAVLRAAVIVAVLSLFAAAAVSADSPVAQSGPENAPSLQVAQAEFFSTDVGEDGEIKVFFDAAQAPGDPQAGTYTLTVRVQDANDADAGPLDVPLTVVLVGPLAVSTPLPLVKCPLGDNECFGNFTPGDHIDGGGGRQNFRGSLINPPDGVGNQAAAISGGADFFLVAVDGLSVPGDSLSYGNCNGGFATIVEVCLDAFRIITLTLEVYDDDARQIGGTVALLLTVQFGEPPSPLVVSTPLPLVSCPLQVGGTRGGANECDETIDLDDHISGGGSGRNLSGVVIPPYPVSVLVQHGLTPDSIDADPRVGILHVDNPSIDDDGIVFESCLTSATTGLCVTEARAITAHIRVSNAVPGALGDPVDLALTVRWQAPPPPFTAGSLGSAFYSSFSGDFFYRLADEISGGSGDLSNLRFNFINPPHNQIRNGTAQFTSGPLLWWRRDGNRLLIGRNNGTPGTGTLSIILDITDVGTGQTARITGTITRYPE